MEPKTLGVTRGEAKRAVQESVVETGKRSCAILVPAALFLFIVIHRLLTTYFKKCWLG